MKKLAVPLTEPMQQFHLGIVRHYTGDLFFHNHPLFIQSVAETLQAFMNGGISRKEYRLSVLAHIAVEMMVDRQIVLENRAFCDQFYNTIHAADVAVMQQYFQALGLEVEFENFLSKFQVFKERRFIYLLENMQHLAEGLSRIYQSATGTGLGHEKEKFVAALCNIDGAVRYRWRQLLNTEEIP